jgi:recombinational DNA repair protein RecT
MTDEQTATQPEQKLPTIGQIKKMTCDKLTKIFTSDLMQERLLKMVGGDASRLTKYLTAYLSVITEDDGGTSKKFYAQCSISSLVTCFLGSVSMHLPFDSRKLVCLIIYDWEAELDISYKGFVNALNRAYSNAFVECKLVFENDIFIPKINDRIASYQFEPADAFRAIDKDFTGIRGGYCFFSYTDTDGEKTSRLVFLSKEQILANRRRAKTKYVWDSDPKAMGEKTCIREGAKIPFAAIDMEVDIEEVANKHFTLGKSDSQARLENLIKAQEDIVNEPVEPKPTEPPAEDKEPEPTSDPRPTPPATPACDESYPEVDVLPEREESPAHAAQGTVSDAAFVEVPATVPQKEPEQDKEPAAWDGKTLYTGTATPAVKDFENSQAAVLYLKKIMEARKHKQTRKKLIEGNSALIAAIIRDGHGAMVMELHQLADQGAEA